MLDELKERLTGLLCRVELAPERVMEPPPMPGMIESHADPISPLGSPQGSPMGSDVGVLEAAPVNVSARPARTPVVDPSDETTWAATPRNAPCPCGSGKKYKHCHGRLS